MEQQITEWLEIAMLWGMRALCAFITYGAITLRRWDLGVLAFVALILSTGMAIERATPMEDHE